MTTATSNGPQPDAKKGYANEGFVPDPPADQTPSPPRPLKGDEEKPSEKLEFPAKEKWRILKNVSALSCAFMIQFTAFQGTANLQSSINAADGLGTVSLCTIYAALVVSSIFTPTYIIKRLTVKWTLCATMLCYIPYIAAQFYPRFYTLVPAGVVLGAGAAPMWAAQATYLTQVSGVYAKLTIQSVEGIISRFFGFFFLAWQTAELWGNLVSSLVLSSGAHSTKIRGGTSPNISHVESSVDHCGANFCVTGNHNNDNLERPPDSEIYEIAGIYLACILLAVAFIALLVDPLSRYGESRRKGNFEEEISGIKLLSATAFQLKKTKQQLLIPITLWIGMEQAFIGAEFTQAYVSCALGIHWIGYVMICFGVVNAICSLLSGSLTKYTGRIPLFIIGFIVHLALIVVLIIWKPHPDSPWAFFIISGAWGVGDAIWQTQLNGLYGTLFRRNKEAAFSNYRLWESAGFVIAYAYSTHLCAIKKLYALLTILVLGIMGYTVVEILQKRKALKAKKEAEEPVKDGNTEQVEEAEEDDEKDDLDDEIVVTHM